jgi:hypothetical protein
MALWKDWLRNMKVIGLDAQNKFSLNGVCHTRRAGETLCLSKQPLFTLNRLAMIRKGSRYRGSLPLCSAKDAGNSFWGL